MIRLCLVEMYLHTLYYVCESILTDITVDSQVIIRPDPLASTCFDVTAIADSVGLEGNQTLVLELSTDNEFFVLTEPRINITIIDNDSK